MTLSMLLPTTSTALSQHSKWPIITVLLLSLLFFVAQASRAQKTAQHTNDDCKTQKTTPSSSQYCSNQEQQSRAAMRTSTVSNEVLSEDDKRLFIEQGYIIIRQAISPEMVAAALNVTDTAYTNKQFTLDETKQRPLTAFDGEVQSHPHVGQLFNNSKLYRAAEDLLGVSNVARTASAQIAYRHPDDMETIMSTLRKAKAKHSASDTFNSDLMIDSLQYHIDATNPRYIHNGFTMLVGICLSAGQHIDENRGQFLAWPGSHVKIHQCLCQRARDGLIVLGNVLGGNLLKPDVGQPKRVLLYPGDAVIAHQRLGHASGINLHSTVRKNLYFRVRHKSHDNLIPKLMSGSVFTEYQGLHHLIDQSEL